MALIPILKDMVKSSQNHNMVWRSSLEFSKGICSV